MKLNAVLEYKQILETKTGVSKAGNPWKSSTILTRETSESGKYDQDIVFNAFGDLADRFAELEGGEDISVEFTPECREYNGKYYTNLKVLGFHVLNYNQPETVNAPIPETSKDLFNQPTATIPVSTVNTAQTIIDDIQDGLPF